MESYHNVLQQSLFLNKTCPDQISHAAFFYHGNENCKKEKKKYLPSKPEFAQTNLKRN